jgi:hypothetical protein
MALAVVDGIHIRVTCDGCRSATAEVCSRRDLPVVARVAAIRKFRATGWHHDAGYHARLKTQEQIDRDGAGRWYCPECGKKTHL